LWTGIITNKGGRIIMNIKIGETLIAVESDGDCCGCFFREINNMDCANTLKCMKHDREDKKSVIFKIINNKEPLHWRIKHSMVSGDGYICPICGTEDCQPYNFCRCCGQSLKPPLKEPEEKIEVEGVDYKKDEGLTDIEFPCSLHDTPRTLDWCEENCPRYYSCDTVAWAQDDLKKINGEE